tara:strand:- start:91 stop:600 length:510 start_codon:yes stop_codon:yes gene_type:complete
MKLGNELKIIIILFLYFQLNLPSFSEEKITTVPLINLEKIKPSFEDVEEKNENLVTTNKLKKKDIINKSNFPHATLIGLDKITAKSKRIIVNINEPKKFGPLEIKVLKCGKVKVNNKFDDVAYLQVKDLTKSENEKVFIFNGWTFSSDPNLTPFDHAIYDLQLLNCYNV